MVHGRGRSGNYGVNDTDELKLRAAATQVLEIHFHGRSIEFVLS